MEEKTFDLTLTRGDEFQFVVEFDGAKMADLLLDEPAPLGSDEGPNAARVLGAAIGNCLSASLLFCLKRARVDVAGMQTEVHGRITRNDEGRFRIGGISTRIVTAIPAEDQERVNRCLGVFEDFCIVSGSVRQGIEIDVEVEVVTPDAAPTP
jgi:uncharacterized OsmC-like protein